MNIFFRRLCPVFLLLSAMIASAKEKPAGQIFSDVHTAEDSGDLAGTEVELKIEGTSATGVARIYQGRCAEPMKLAGSVSGNVIHVSGEGEGFGKIDISGKLQHGHFNGTLRLDRDHSSEKIRLKKISKPHC